VSHCTTGKDTGTAGCLTAELVRTQGQQAVSHCTTGKDTGAAGCVSLHNW